MTITIGFALVVVIATIYALIKRYETRLTLITAGLAMAVFSLKPMVAFKQFDASMTRGSLIIAICTAMVHAGDRIMRCGYPFNGRALRCGRPLNDPDSDTRRIQTSYCSCRHCLFNNPCLV